MTIQGICALLILVKRLGGCWYFLQRRPCQGGIQNNETLGIKQAFLQHTSVQFKGASELTNEVTLPEADVMCFVKLDKGDFIGKAETVASLESPLPWVCAYLAIETDGLSDGSGGEAILMVDQVVGSISSVAYGHSVGHILAFAYIKPEAAEPGTELEVVIASASRTATALDEAAYDPENLRPREDG